MADDSDTTSMGSWSDNTTRSEEYPAQQISRSELIEALSSDSIVLATGTEFRFQLIEIDVDVKDGQTRAVLTSWSNAKISIPFPAVIATLTTAAQKTFLANVRCFNFGPNYGDANFNGLQLAVDVLHRLPKHHIPRRESKSFHQVGIRITTGGDEVEVKNFAQKIRTMLQGLANVEPARRLRDIPLKINYARVSDQYENDGKHLHFSIDGILGFSIDVVMCASPGVASDHVRLEIKKYWRWLNILRSDLETMRASQTPAVDRLGSLPVEIIGNIVQHLMPKQAIFAYPRDGQGRRVDLWRADGSQRTLMLYAGEPFSSPTVKLAILSLTQQIRYVALAKLFDMVPVTVASELCNRDWPSNFRIINRSLGLNPFENIAKLQVDFILRNDEVTHQNQRVQSVRLRRNSQAKLTNLKKLLTHRFGGMSNTGQSIIQMACIFVDYDDVYPNPDAPFEPKIVLKVSLDGGLDLEIDISFVKVLYFGGFMSAHLSKNEQVDITWQHTLAARRFIHRILRRFANQHNMMLQGDFNDP